MFEQFATVNGDEVAYGGIGSGGGVRNLKDKIVDFAGSDAFLSDEEMAGMDEVIHVPSCMGAVVLAAGTKGKRYALPHARVMIHQPSGGAEGMASDILINAEEIRKCRNTLNGMLAEACGKSVEEVARDTDRDFWLSAEEAKAYGLIDTILEPRKKATLA